jgi:hypothetical protein
MPEIHATRPAEPGWWSARYIHPVHKNVTGVARMCEYLGKLPADELEVAKDVYQNRLFNS